MPEPGERKIGQARVLAYAQEISWTCPHEEAEGGIGWGGCAILPVYCQIEKPGGLRALYLAR